MRTLALAAMLLVAVATCGHPSGAFVFGRSSYGGDVCSDCDSEPETANFYGLTYHMHSLSLVDLSAGIEYASSDVGFACGDQRGTGDFSHIGLNFGGSVPLVSLMLVRVYAGAGFSYNWFRFGNLLCRAQDDLDGSVGYHGLVGLEATSRGVPLRTYLEGRLRRIGSAPHITSQSIYLGFELRI
jgi:hypothetical protein